MGGHCVGNSPTAFHAARAYFPSELSHQRYLHPTLCLTKKISHPHSHPGFLLLQLDVIAWLPVSPLWPPLFWALYYITPAPASEKYLP